jgi:hypothetical protein
MDALIARFGDTPTQFSSGTTLRALVIGVPKMRRIRTTSLSIFLSIGAVRKPGRIGPRSRRIRKWKEVKADSEIEGPLANHIDSYFMDPTSF